MLLSRWLYYFSSIPTLFRGIKNWRTMLRVFLGIRVPAPIILELANGLRFHVRTRMDIWVLKEACLDRQYQDASVPIKDGWNIIDIGAGLGDFALAAANAHPNAVVYAYEPFPESFALLQENLRLNQIENVRAFPLAVGAQSGSMQLRAVSAEAVQQTTIGAASTTHAVEIQVQSVTLDQVLADAKLPRCDYLKMDCEGAEYGIFFNTPAAVLEKIDNICLEYHDGVTTFSHADLVRFFELNGFQVTWTPNPAHRNLGLLYAARASGSPSLK